MNTLQFIQKLPKRLFIAICLVFLFGFGPKIFIDQVFSQNPTSIQAASPSDQNPSKFPTESPVPTKDQVTSPVPTVTPVKGGTATVQCPDGITHIVKSGESVDLSCQTPQPTSTPALEATTSATVKELPKTGLPIAGLVLTGLIPFGVKLRKFGNITNKDYSPSSLWTNRELMK